MPGDLRRLPWNDCLIHFLVDDFSFPVGNDTDQTNRVWGSEIPEVEIPGAAEGPFVVESERQGAG
jgi:hypothetical protein